MTKIFFAFATAFALVTAGLSANAADIPLKAPRYSAPTPPRVAARTKCAWVIVEVHNYGGEPFRVEAIGGNQYGSKMTLDIALKGDRLCVPPEFFQRANEVHICLGQGPTNARFVRGHWMEIARANLARGDVVNPGEPMVWRGYQPSQYRRPMYNHRQRPLISNQALRGVALLGGGILIGRAMR